MSQGGIDLVQYFTERGFAVSDTGEIMTRDANKGGLATVELLLCAWSRSAPHDRRWTATSVGSVKGGLMAQDQVVSFHDNQTDPIAAYALAELRGWRRPENGG